MALRELLLRLGVDVDPAGVKNADNALSKIKKAAVVAAAAFAAIKAVKGIGAIVDDVRATGDELDKTSQQLGISTDALQEWRFAAGLAGATGAEMSNSLAKLQKNAFDAATGGTTMADDFKKLGVDVLDASGEVKDANTLLTDMADGFANLSNDTERSALAQNLMGRAGKKLIPLLKGGTKAIEEMKAEAQSLGGIMGKDLIAATVKLTDDQLRSQQAWQGVKNDLAGKIIPIFIKVTNVMIGVAKAIRGPLSVAFNVIQRSVEVITNIIEAMIGTWNELDGVIDKLTVALPFLGIAFTLVGRKAIVAGVKTAAAWVLAALPIILMVALIAILLLAIEDFIVFMKGGDSVIGRLIERFKKWVDEMGGVGEAIKKVFIKIFESIFGVSKETATHIIGAFQLIWADIADGFGFLSDKLSDAMVWVVDFSTGLVDNISAAIDFVVNKFEVLTDAVADAIGAVADFVGLGDDVAEGSEGLTPEEAERRRKKSIDKQIAIFQKLEKEGFGTATVQRNEEGKFVSAGLTNVKDEGAALARRSQLQQDINSPITVHVDARGQTNEAVGNTVAGKINQKQRDRQNSQNYITQPDPA